MLKEKPSNTQAWVKALIDGSVPPEKPVAPVIIFWGTEDTVVPPPSWASSTKIRCAL